ncbi:MAG: ribosome biogenesis GTP-binding protein YihA/YsxC [Neisseriaceae bacterium]
MCKDFFRGAQFFTTINHLKDLPSVKKEVAFVGRSNAGKSSAINALTGHRRLAYVSKTPGRTQYINYFQLKNEGFIVDLPGYGYAAVPSEMRRHWVSLLGDYLATRTSLLGLVMIMDIRHPLKELDQKMLDFFAPRKLPIHILLTKADKLSKQQQRKSLKEMQKSLILQHGQSNPITSQVFSSLEKMNIGEVEQVVGSWFV